MSPHWLTNLHNFAITGPTRVAESYLSVALGITAIRVRYLVGCYKLSRLLEKAGIARADGTYPQFASTLARTDLPVLDD
jgi:DNA replication protein DnaC